VVDHHSHEGSADAIAAEFPGVVLMRSEVNLGFAGANNLAARGATGEFLLLLNPDTVVLGRAVERLVAFAESRPEAGIWGGRTVFADGSLNPTSCWAKPTPWSLLCLGTGLSSVMRRSRVFNPEGYGGWQRDAVREVDIVTGCFLLIRRSLWERLGGFDPAFFMYGEEADLCLRARALGARPVITPEATIVHYGGASERVRADKMVRLLTAKVLLLKRHWRPRLVPLGVAILKAWPLTRGLAWSVVSLGWRRRALEQAGMWWTVWSRRAEWAAAA
jgi:GT2 family glycosyltransferase